MSEVGVEVGLHTAKILPVMEGDARVARGASHFVVPIFTRLTRLLWMGCSPAEFPDELVECGYLPLRRWSRPVRCHWLYEEVGGSAAENDPPIRVPAFDAILNLYPWGKYVVPEGVEYREVEMYDSEEGPAQEQVDELADWVASMCGFGRSGRVLVHCQAGLNRSSLIAARALMLAKEMSADDAIALIRRERSAMCLCNQTFEALLRSL